ncbi:uncharacterized protein LOC136086097 [Hydra vulgaris]|uniref:Uncharacterized protein LOC136086097 n=1 Tax=Hydra vulgaris TaxID=6087 RepID=A0ABM4CRE3_HYDVU
MSDQTETNKILTGQCSSNEVSKIRGRIAVKEYLNFFTLLTFLEKNRSLKALAELPKKKKIRIIEDNSEDDVDFQKVFQHSGLHDKEVDDIIVVEGKTASVVSECERESISDVEEDHSNIIDDHHVLTQKTKEDIIRVYDKPQSDDFYKTRSFKNSRSSILAITLVGERLIMTGVITRELWRDEEVKLPESSLLLDLYSDMEWEGIRWMLKNA